MEIAADRMVEFLENIQGGSDEQVAGILNYVGSVNEGQRELLVAGRD